MSIAQKRELKRLDSIQQDRDRFWLMIKAERRARKLDRIIRSDWVKRKQVERGKASIMFSRFILRYSAWADRGVVRSPAQWAFFQHLVDCKKRLFYR